MLGVRLWPGFGGGGVTMTAAVVAERGRCGRDDGGAGEDC